MFTEKTISNDQMILSVDELKKKGLTLYRINRLVDQGILKKLNKKYYENTKYCYFANTYLQIRIKKLRLSYPENREVEIVKCW